MKESFKQQSSIIPPIAMKRSTTFASPIIECIKVSIYGLGQAQKSAGMRSQLKHTIHFKLL